MKNILLILVVTFTVASAQEPMIRASGFIMEETWEHSVGETLHPGDAVKRTVTMQAPGIPGMTIPPLLVEEMKNVGIYKSAPFVKDREEHGNFTGRRIETFVYVFEKPGTFIIPGFSLTWWNIETRQLLTAQLPPRTFIVADIPPFEKSKTSPLLIISGMFILIGMAVWIILPRRQNPDTPPAKSKSEYDLFQEIHIACEKNDPRQVYDTILAWLNQTGVAQTLEQLAKKARDPELSEQLAALQAHLFLSSHEIWAAGELWASLAKARHTLLHPPKPITKLIPLNP